MNTGKLIFCLVFVSTIGIPAFCEDRGATTAPIPEIPTTLEEAHSVLEQILSSTELQKIDAMKSEKEMVGYHFGLGMNIRNIWGLWQDSPLAKYFKGMGLYHPDDMSAVILQTFWYKRHNQEFNLNQKIEKYTRYWDEVRDANAIEAKRSEIAKQKIQSMMMGITLSPSEVQEIILPDRGMDSIRARSLAVYRDGVYITVLKPTGRKDEDFRTEGYFYHNKDQLIHRIHVPEMGEIYSTVVIGSILWLSGLSDGQSLIIGINGNERLLIPSPKKGVLPQLGTDGRNPIAVLSNSIFRLQGKKWKELYTGGNKLPKSGPPPELHGKQIFFRDEGSGGNMKRLWVLDIENSILASVDKDVGVVGSSGPRWENSFSYRVSKDNMLWFTVGETITRKSLLRKLPDGRYEIAIMNNSVNFTPNFFGSNDSDQNIDISALEIRPDNSLVLVGESGFYFLKGKVLSQKIRFENSRQLIPIPGRDNVYHWGWNPSKVIQIQENSYLISGEFGGIYYLKRNESQKWSIVSLDETLGKDIVW